MNEATLENFASVFLPKSLFPMRGNMSLIEPELAQKWHENNFYQKRRHARKNCPSFILHDGPPFANGHLHIGHALNHYLKDTFNRMAFLAGYDVIFVPGWDCHGLPIEAKVEEVYTSKKIDPKTVSIAQLRDDCRQFASKWIEEQKKTLLRLGIYGDWNHPYTTMADTSEKIIMKAFLQLVKKGAVVSGKKPVWWSPSENTALAEAEIEYKDKSSQAIDVSCRLITGAYAGTSLVIWTTTPWTLPGNCAIAFNSELIYGLYQPEDASHPGLWVAESLWEAFQKRTGLMHWNAVTRIEGHEWKNHQYEHPLKHAGYTKLCPLLSATFVTDDVGTGFVHCAPAHGEEDFLLGLEHHLHIEDSLDDICCFHASVPLVGGISWDQVNPIISNFLIQHHQLWSQIPYVHSYPHSWRSGKPLICRVTPQWFIDMEGPCSLREHALELLKTVTWIPASGFNRITSMIAQRRHWCVSRQRSWGIPLPIIINKEGNLRSEPVVFEAIENFIDHSGVNGWFEATAKDILGIIAQDGDKVIKDIMDVWFESGVTHEYVLSAHSELHYPSDMVLEGSDQHRGWFQSSLLSSVLLKNSAPFKTVLTHGFIMDERGQKISKSKGNVKTSLEELLDLYGSDVLRLWALNSEFTHDVKLSETLLSHTQEIYRRFRNILRFLLGSLEDFNTEEKISYDFLNIREQWMLFELSKLLTLWKERQETKHWEGWIAHLYTWITQIFSPLYVDVIKDSLYCDQVSDLQRRGIRTVLNEALNILGRIFAPLMPFTLQQAWSYWPQGCHDFESFPKEDRFVETTLWHMGPHCHRMPEAPSLWKNHELETSMNLFFSCRHAVMCGLEQARNAGVIGDGLETCVVIYDDKLAHVLEQAPHLLPMWLDLCGISQGEIFSLKDLNGFFKKDVERFEMLSKIYLKYGMDTHHLFEIYEGNLSFLKELPDISSEDFKIMSDIIMLMPKICKKNHIPFKYLLDIIQGTTLKVFPDAIYVWEDESKNDFIPVQVILARGKKCPRCWKRHETQTILCQRCEEYRIH
jgi:isoleucyl-tRNA synthetase